MALIPLSGPNGAGLFAIVDDGDVELVSRFRWFVKRRPRTTYAYANKPGRGNGTIYLHQVLMPEAQFVDHVNGDGLDNQRSNIRPATRTDNARNRRNFTGRYKGVSREHSRYCAYIGVNKKMRGVGRFDTPEEAARAYDAAALELFGEFASLNFPKLRDETAA